MKEESLQIDFAAVAKEALRDRQPGEDLDEALLRVCKDLYGTKGLDVFQSVRKAAEAYAAQRNVGMESGLQEIARGGASSIATFSKTFTAQKTTSLEELPPEMRESVRKLLESGKSDGIVFNHTISGSGALGSLLGFGLRLLLHSHKQPVSISKPPGTGDAAAPNPAAVAGPADKSARLDPPLQPRAGTPQAGPPAGHGALRELPARIRQRAHLLPRLRH